MLKARFEGALSLPEFVETAEANADLWRAMMKRAEVPEDLVERLGRIPERRYLLVLLEDWCGDAVNTIPVLHRLAERVPGLELRVLERDRNLDLMDAHLSGSSRAIPVVMVLDEQFQEVAWWGSRPAELQAWVESDEGQALSREDRYREIRRWYARDRGRSTLREVAELVERQVPAALS